MAADKRMGDVLDGRGMGCQEVFYRWVARCWWRQRAALQTDLLHNVYVTESMAERGYGP